jgi:hypothetical protein
MPKTILQVVRGAYRATLEEQDDTVLWLTQAMKGAGADLTVVLAENAVSYAVAAQDASGLAFGERRQTQPPRIADDLTRITGKGITVYYVQEDAADRGIEAGELIPSVKALPRREVAALATKHDQVWLW